MVAKCPCCDNTVTDIDNPCPYCGAAASMFISFEDSAPIHDKVSDKSPERGVQSVLLFAALIDIFIINIPIRVIVRMAVMCLCLGYRKSLFKGAGKVAFFISLADVILMLTVIIIAAIAVST